jgi:carboxyl-terminal processing protease
MAVLIDGYSASASEIVAACLQDHGRAVVVGTQSFGKGTVQSVIGLDGDRSVLKLTTAKYWRPSERNIHRTPKNKSDKSAWGVRPNEGLEVELTAEQAKALAIARGQRDRWKPQKSAPQPKPVSKKSDGSHSAEAPKPFVDPQLDKAVRYLQSKL